MPEQWLSDLDLKALTRRRLFPTPSAWEGLVPNFLLDDRFADGRENVYVDNDGNVVIARTTLPFKPEVGV